MSARKKARPHQVRTVLITPETDPSEIEDLLGSMDTSGVSAEKWERDAKATHAAVRKWKRKHPASKPRVSLPKMNTALIASLDTALKSTILDMNASARVLGHYVAGQVEDSTWLMFYTAWKSEYERPN